MPVKSGFYKVPMDPVKRSNRVGRLKFAVEPFNQNNVQQLSGSGI